MSPERLDRASDDSDAEIQGYSLSGSWRILWNRGRKNRKSQRSQATTKQETDMPTRNHTCYKTRSYIYVHTYI